ncbi:unnamed protein product [Clavelina lepadiformis]|uniref:Uncharacterized protein n=1 Tax=Clavelina lepadiformis TaxID=159417 RepID=A0ABP0G789_CLALP
MASSDLRLEDMSHPQPIQHSLDLADRHLDNMIFEQINYNDGDEESPGLQPTSNATMTDEQSTPVKTLCRYLDIQ